MDADRKIWIRIPLIFIFTQKNFHNFSPTFVIVLLLCHRFDVGRDEGDCSFIQKLVHVSSFFQLFQSFGIAHKLLLFINFDYQWLDTIKSWDELLDITPFIFYYNVQYVLVVTIISVLNRFIVFSHLYVKEYTHFCD